MKTFLSITSFVLYIVAGLCIATGFDKFLNYTNYEDDTLYDLSTNAYVGGDAYNFIINGTYMTAFFALGGALIIAATFMGMTAVYLHHSTKNLGGINHGTSQSHD